MRIWDAFIWRIAGRIKKQNRPVFVKTGLFSEGLFCQRQRRLLNS